MWWVSFLFVRLFFFIRVHDQLWYVRSITLLCPFSYLLDIKKWHLHYLCNSHDKAFENFATIATKNFTHFWCFTGPDVGQCPEPDSPNTVQKLQSAHIIYRSTNRIDYSCPAGYHMNGPAYIVCLTNNEWDASPPTCEPSADPNESTCEDFVSECTMWAEAGLCVGEGSIQDRVRKSCPKRCWLCESTGHSEKGNDWHIINHCKDLGHFWLGYLVT